VPLGQPGDLGRPLRARRADLVHRPAGAELDVDGEVILDLGLARPERARRLVGTPLLQGIDVAPDAAVDLQRLVVDEADLRLVFGPDAGDRELVRVVLDLILLLRARALGDAGVVAGSLLFAVDALRLLRVDDLALEGLLPAPDGDLGEAGAGGDGKGVDGLEVPVVGVEEGLRDRRPREAVVDDDVDEMLADLNRRARRAGRRERPSSEERRRGDKSEQREVFHAPRRERASCQGGERVDSMGYDTRDSPAVLWMYSTIHVAPPRQPPGRRRY
jgi:hypothetical protein